MKKSTMTVEYAAPIQNVWDIVTDNTRTAWRSDLDRVEVLDDNTFIEVAKGGFSSTFTITAKEPLRRYAFRMDNPRFSGSWEGIFSALPNGGTRIIFNEELEMKNPLTKFLSRFMNLQKMQQTYAEDLRRALLD